MPAFCAQKALSPAMLAWQGRTTWCMLSTDFGHGEDFLRCWAAWQADTQRSRLLHFTAIVADTLCPAEVQAHAPEGLQAQAQALAAQLYGLLPGVHRLSLEGGRVLLTLWVGDVQPLLRQQSSTADAILLHAPFACDSHSIKALARHCQRGTALLAAGATPDLLQALQTAGFSLQADQPQLAHFAPRWEPRKRSSGPQPVAQVGTALVVGAGLAGAAVAHSLALRGWQVQVLGAGAEAADGASGLPAGLFCPHVSPDDSVLSRLSRSGVRMTLQRLRDLCQQGQDWGYSGVLEHCTDGGTGLPASWVRGPGAQWSHAPQPAQLAAAGLPADTVACWHAQAGWVRPAQLVRAQLAHPLIRFQGHAHVARLAYTETQQWQAVDAQGQPLAQADIAILACGPGTAALLPTGTAWPLQALRGQITWGWHSADTASALPPFPVNGNGNLVTHVPGAQGQFWVMGSTFERDVDRMPITAPEQITAHAENYAKLSTLLPASAPHLRPWFTPGDAHCQPTWGRVRVASHDRLPIAGPVSTAPGLWACTAMGARGLTLSVLCGEWIAAQLHAEPWPLDARLAPHLDTQRLARHRSAASA